ncbi:hypothetical protein DJ030_11245 [bacterium endosymbiont of Escarpia laminata]|nr:MAG: hypothetical protein DJ030_11245 [bacterium endosymbiont of Escarpia laminata]
MSGHRLEGTDRSVQYDVKSWFIGLAAAWTLCILSALAWGVHHEYQDIQEQARTQLRTNFFKDLAFRRWGAKHGGVYVPVTEQTQPDPLLADYPERDVTTPSGRLLTLINPALMTRRFYELVDEGDTGVRGHISGLRPLNPANKPDTWEAEAMEAFKGGAREVTAVTALDGQPYLRLIRPLMMTKPCLKCHIQQGFKLDDLSGAISVSIPMARLEVEARHHTQVMIAILVTIWLVGMAGLGMGYRRQSLHIREREQAEWNLRESEKKIRQDYHSQRVLSSILKISMQSVPLKEKLEQSLDQVLSIPWFHIQEKGCIFLVEGDDPSLIMQAQRGLSKSLQTACATVPFGKCLCGRAAQSDEIIFTDCVDERHLDTGMPMADHGHYCVPILSNDRTIGILNLYVETHHRKSEDEVRFLMAVTHVLAGMIMQDQAEQELQQHAFYDVLTKLPNRALFMERLDRLIQHSKRHPDSLFAVLFLDLDRFKNINDSLGHTAGDQLLIVASERLQACIRPSDTVARLGGDEFIILLDEIDDVAEPYRIAGRIHEMFKRPFELAGHEVFSTTSVGIALAKPNGQDAEKLLRNADSAMYRAKNQGSGQTAVFDSEMHAQAIMLLNKEIDLRQAVENEALQVHYQPIIGIESDRLVGFEALARWDHPIYGMVSPDEFIWIAEESGLIQALGAQILGKACRQMQRWISQSPSQADLYVSVNLSLKQVLFPGYIDWLENVLRETGLPPKSLRLEITESILMEDVETTCAILDQIKQLGVGLYIDDFGTGYSSMSYLHRFPFDALKVDRSFVSNIGKGTQYADLIGGIIAVAKSFRMDVIAEGVERQEQLEKLQELGCNSVQGYIFSPPVTSKEAEKLLTRKSGWMVPAPTGTGTKHHSQPFRLA